MEVYRACCEAEGVKPNSAIVSQLNRVNVCQLQEIDASRTLLGAKGVLALLNFIAVHDGIRHVNLRKNGVDAVCIKRLCDLAAQHVSLQTVNLSGNALSTPSVRTLWETAKRVPTLRSIIVTDCGVAPEWVKRIEHVTKANAELQQLGFHPSGPPRPVSSWASAIICVAGTGPRLDAMCDYIIPRLNSLLAGLRVRVTALAIRENDASEVRAWKYRMSSSPQNHDVPWTLCLVDYTAAGGAAPRGDDGGADSIWPETVIREICDAYRPPPVPPLRNKLGKLREPMYRHAPNMFVLCMAKDGLVEKGSHLLSGGLSDELWDAPLNATLGGGVRMDASPRGKLRRAVGDYRQLGAMCSVHTTQESLFFQAETQLLASLEMTYGVDRLSEPTPQSDLQTQSPISQCNWDMCREKWEARGGPSVELKEVLRHINAPSTSDSIPLILYGACGTRKGTILATAAMTLSHRTAAPSPTPQPIASNVVSASASLGTSLARALPTEPVECIPYFVGTYSSSLVVFLFFLLDELRRISSLSAAAGGDASAAERPSIGSVGGAPRQSVCCPSESRDLPVFHSMEKLMDTVRDALQRYRGKKIAILLARLDHFDSGIRPLVDPLRWLPAVLSRHIRLIISCNTESVFLPELRKRSPLPYEVLSSTYPTPQRVELLLDALRRHRVELPGVNVSPARTPPSSSSQAADGATTSAAPSSVAGIRRDVVYQQQSSAVTEFLAKEHSGRYLFSNLVAVAIKLQQRIFTTVSEVEKFFESDVPDTIDSLVEQILDFYESKSTNPAVVSHVALCLSVASLAIPDVVYICEVLLGVDLFSTLPLVLKMAEDGLLTITTLSDSVVRMSQRMRQIVRKRYAASAEQASALVQTHLCRLITTHSPEMVHAFKEVVPLLTDSGSVDSARDLVLNVSVVGELLARDVMGRILVSAALFRLIDACALLEEVTGGDFCQFLHNDLRSALPRALRDVQTSGRFFVQTALVSRSHSPYTAAALALKPEELFYPTLTPLNRHRGECSGHVIDLEHPCLHCHASGDLVAVTTASEVTIVSLEDRSVYARMRKPFDTTQQLLGAIFAADSRVIVVGSTQLLIWNTAMQSWVILDDCTCSISGLNLDASGLTALVVRPSTSEIAILDIARKRILTELNSAAVEGPVREVIHCGPNALVVSLYDCYLLSDAVTIVLPHEMLVRCATASRNGKLVATGSGSFIYIWNAETGSAMHQIHEERMVVNDLRFNSTGSHLVATTASGTLDVWHSVGGDLIVSHPVTPLGLPFACFSDDDRRIIGRSDGLLRVWDVGNECEIGALNCGDPIITYCAAHPKYYVAVTNVGRVVIWPIHTPLSPLSTVETAGLSTNLSIDARVMQAAVVSISASASGHTIAMVTANHHLCVCPFNGEVAMAGGGAAAASAGRLAAGSGTSGLCFSGVLAAVVLDDRRIVQLTTSGLLRVSHSDDNWRSECHPSDGATLGDAPVAVSVNKEGRGIVSASLVASRDSTHLAAVIRYNGDARTTVIACALSPSLEVRSVFSGHEGEVLTAFFSGAFLVTAGTDQWVTLWSLAAHAARTSYRHPQPIRAAAPHQLAGATTDLPHGVLLIDGTGRVFALTVCHIASMEETTFAALEVPLQKPLPPLREPTTVVAVLEGLFLVGDRDGSLLLVNVATGEGLVNCIQAYSCRSLACVEWVTEKRVDSGSRARVRTAVPLVAVGTANGECILHAVAAGGSGAPAAVA